MIFRSNYYKPVKNIENFDLLFFNALSICDRPCKIKYFGQKFDPIKYKGR